MEIPGEPKDPSSFHYELCTPLSGSQSKDSSLKRYHICSCFTFIHSKELKVATEIKYIKLLLIHSFRTNILLHSVIIIQNTVALNY